MQDLFTVTFKGHPNVRATNRMTLELTREDFLTLRGDCILGILADAACRDLSNEAKAQICTDDSKLRFRIEVEGEHFIDSAKNIGPYIVCQRAAGMSPEPEP